MFDSFKHYCSRLKKLYNKYRDPEYIQSQQEKLVDKIQNYLSSSDDNSCLHEKGAGYVVKEDKKGLVFRVKGVGFRMIPVEGGTFQMGKTDDQLDDYNRTFYNANDVHTETVGDFYIGETAVTQELWEAILGYNPIQIKLWLSPEQPVYNITWDDCQRFIYYLNKITGYNFRLPSSAEWEYAARGGQKTKHYKYAGSNDPDDVVSGKVREGLAKPCDVARKDPNELGLYDMCGNVWEWCNDVQVDEHDKWETPEQRSHDIKRAIIRGGSCQEEDEDNTISFVGLRITDNILDYVGFRLAL